jgi:tyrosine aminotransferase
MMMKVVVPSTLMQAAIPDVLKNTPDLYIRETMAVFESNADICCSILKGIPGLNPIQPTGAMYIMVRK